MADLTMGFGLARLGMMLVRAELTSLVPPATLRGLTVPRLLEQGGFEVKITALSDRWLPEVIKRDLYLFGLDHVRGGLTRTRPSASASTARAEVTDGRLRCHGARDVARAYLSSTCWRPVSWHEQFVAGLR
jgi:hypothetical protein